MSSPDHVTGLSSRSDLQALLDRLAAGGGSFALVICDVVGLKAINERDGFLAGDAALRAAADRLRSAAADASLVARLGGDEMIAVFTGAGAAGVAGRCATVLAGPGAASLRAAALIAETGERPGPLVERAYATMRRS